MEHEIRDFKLVLIDEPLQSHVVAWEQAARALQSEDAKPLLDRIMAELRNISVTERNPRTLINAFQVITEALEQAIDVLNANETLTLSANRGTYVKAAIRSSWIVSPELKESDVDGMKPWLVKWIAEKVGTLYLEVTNIPPK